MFLRQIKLKNFLSHEDLEISFPGQGSFLLTGQSGIGKSSLIIDAIAYSLYGSVATRSKKQTELRNNDSPSQPMSVETVWDFENETVAFARGIDGRNSSWATAYQYGQDEAIILAEGIKPVSRVVAKRMGNMTWQQFYSAFVARQSEITLLTTLKGVQRKELIHQMLGMRELEKAEQIVTTRLRRAKAERDQLEKSVGGIDLEKENNKLIDLEHNLDQLKKEAEANEKDSSRLSNEIKELDKELTSLKADLVVFEQRKDLEKDIASLKTSLESLAVLAKKHQEAAAKLSDRNSKTIHQEINSLKQTRKDLREEFLLKKEMTDLKAEIKELENDLDSLKKEIYSELNFESSLLDSFKKNPTTQLLNNLVIVLKEDIKKDQEVIENIQTRARDIKEVDQCFVCHKPLDKNDRSLIIKHNEDEINLLNQAVQDKKAVINSLLNIKEATASFEKVDQLIKEKQSLITSRQEPKNPLDQIKQNGEKLAQEIKEKEKEVEEVESLESDLNKEIFNQFKDKESELEKLNSSLNSLKEIDLNIQEKRDQLNEEKSSLDLEIASNLATLNQINKQIQSAQNDIQTQKKLIKGREKEFSLIKKTEEKITVLDTTTLLVRGYQRHLTTEIRPALEEIASEMITVISEGRHIGIKINDDYEISIEKASGAVLPAQMLSGGEEIRANICLRLALTRLVSQRTGVPVGFLIFDEPLPAQDSGHIEKIIELLESLKPFYRQQFIISHVGELRSEDSINYVLEFERNNNKTTVNLINA
jgi:exonuclease SbcC